MPFSIPGSDRSGSHGSTGFSERMAVFFDHAGRLGGVLFAGWETVTLYWLGIYALHLLFSFTAILFWERIILNPWTIGIIANLNKITQWSSPMLSLCMKMLGRILSLAGHQVSWSFYCIFCTIHRLYHAVLVAQSVVSKSVQHSKNMAQTQIKLEHSAKSIQ